MQPLPVILLLLGVVLVLFITEKWARKGPAAAFWCRKMLHAAGVGALALAPLFFTNAIYLTLVAAFFSVLLLIAVAFGWLQSYQQGRKSWGIALFAPAFLFIWMMGGQHHPYWVIQAMLVLALADPAAALAGTYFPGGSYAAGAERKTITGSVVFTLVAWLVLTGSHLLLKSFFAAPSVGWYHFPFGAALLLYVVVAMVAAVAEGASSGGWDNAAIPVFTCWLLFVCSTYQADVLMSLLLFLPALAFLARLAYLKQWLNTGGSIWAFLLGATIWLAGGWAPLLLMGFFFITGTLTSKLPMPGGQVTDAKLGKARDAAQVLSNGGVAVICLLLFSLEKSPVWLTCFCISVAISTSDTWSSDLGRKWGGGVVDILTFRQSTPGLSGGISLAGCVAGLVAACWVACLSVIMGLTAYGWQVALAGFAGMLADSILGSWLQAAWRNPQTGRWEETASAGSASVPHKGIYWMNNDRVNLLSNLFITILSALAFIFAVRGN